MNRGNKQVSDHSEELYERYVAPMESQHLGEYVAVAEDGRFVFAGSLSELVGRAVKELGPGSFGYKVGERAVGHIR